MHLFCTSKWIVEILPILFYIASIMLNPHVRSVITRFAPLSGLLCSTLRIKILMMMDIWSLSFMSVPIALCKGKKKEKKHLCPESGIVFRFHVSVWLEHEVSEVKNKCFPLVFSSETGSCWRHSRIWSHVQSLILETICYCWRIV